MVIQAILRRNNAVCIPVQQTTKSLLHHHCIRSHSTKQLRAPLHTTATAQLQSRFSHVLLTEPSNQFKILCICTGVTIAGSSIIVLREKLFFGTVAGILAKTCTAPLERLAVFRQASVDYKSSLKLIISGIFNEEGIKGFWRGNGINVFRASIQKGSLFALQDILCQLLTHGEKKKLKQSLGLSFVAGWLAGLTSTLITFPLDTIKTVNQATIHQRRWNAIQVWYSLARRRGLLRGPWTAALPTCIGASFYYAIKFMAFDACIMGIGFVCNRYDFEIQRDIKNAIGGLSAGMIANSITYPNNCIRKRMQTARVCDAIGAKTTFTPQNYLGTAQNFYYHEGGFRRFYKGFGINLIRNAPNTAIQFVVYKRLQALWNEHQNAD